MSDYAGYAGFFGYGEEDPWGTGVAASKWNPMLSETLSMATAPMISAASTGSASRRRYRKGPKQVAGDVVMDVPYEGFGTLLYYLLGAESTANVAGNVYDHTITPSNTLPLGLSVEMNRGGVAATAFRYIGCQVESLALEVNPGEIAKATFGMIGLDEELPTLNPAAAASPTYDDVDPFAYHESDFKVAVYGGSPASLECLGFTLNVTNSLKADKNKLNSRLVAAIPRSGHRMVNGTFKMEFDDMTEYTRFKNSTEMELSFVMTSASVIEAAYYYTVTITMPRCIYTAGPINMSGPELIEVEYTYEAFYDITGSNPEITIAVRDSDTSI